jgi:hypothetical protein
VRRLMLRKIGRVFDKDEPVTHSLAPTRVNS